ncbi:MAG: AtpZ/AtpI family protein [Bacteroidota bacterium]|nr:AtpZ/AtpI family protein [Candidatus Kapabacteria bacterium]MDW8220647.1 AtpZ/AtpI family protein [Bacteroidota bacterium]
MASSSDFKRHVRAGTSLQAIAPAFHLGIELALTVLAFGGIGWLIDTYAQSSPLWLTTLLIFGVTGGMVRFIRSALTLTRKPAYNYQDRQNRQ